MLDIEEILELHDKAYNRGQTTRERATEDLVFYWLTQWDDDLLSESPLMYRGEFNILRKAGRGILADLAQNPVQVDFEPLDDDREDAADLADGLYRKDDTHNTSIESYSNGIQEAVVCGVGAWELHTEYKTSRIGDNKQIIKRRPIYEANNTVFWDPNSKLLDKSDADYVSLIYPFSEDGYKKLVKDLTGEAADPLKAVDFKSPETSNTFRWFLGSGKEIYIGKFYHREKIKENILTMANPLGQTMLLRESELEDVMEEMLDIGFTVESEKEVERWQVTCYICSGKEIIHHSVVAGDNIPVVPAYGERAFVDGEEHYEGIVKLAKDPQRLRNFQLSYLADIVSTSPRPKPVYYPEQIAGYESMYQTAGADNNYPYTLQNRFDISGTELPLGAISVSPEQNIPQALIASIQLSRESVEDVANPGLPQDIADPDTSGKAVLAMQARLDMQSMIYQEHLKHAKRRDGVIWASMAADVYDTPRKEKIVLPDGTRKTVEIMEQVVDPVTGEITTLNDLSNIEFEVYSTITSTYTSKKEQTLARLDSMITAIEPGNPLREIMLLKALKLTDGIDFDDVREYSNKQLILKGIKEPDTEEEKAMLQAAQQQPKEPSAEMILAQGELMKGQAAMMKEKREVMQAQLEFKVDQATNQVDVFRAQTERMNTQIKAQEAGATIENKRIDSFGKKIDNQAKIIQLKQPKDMTNEELLAMLG